MRRFSLSQRLTLLFTVLLLLCATVACAVQLYSSMQYGNAMVQRLSGGVAGQGVQGAMNKTQGVELEIRKDDGSTIMVVQKQGNTRFSAGQRVVLASNGSQVTVSPR